ncbi:MAG: DUF1574 domain-containing protein [Gemmataceae bacterium]|nr:DUF1574 domain-containing protein [Gemmataceae bacterium]
MRLALRGSTRPALVSGEREPAVRVLVVRVPEPPRTAGPRPRLARKKRAVAAVVGGLVLAAAVQVGFGLAVHTERSPLRDPIYFDKLALLRGRPAFFPGPTPAADKPATLLLVGSSRTLNGVDAGAAGDGLTRRLGRPAEVFNFGQAGAGPVTNAVYVRRLIAEGMKPDFALIEVHPVFLAGQRPDPPEGRWLMPFRLRPAELPVVRGMGFPAADPATHGPRGFVAPLYEYRFLVIDRYAPWLLMDNNRLNGGHESDARGFARQFESVTPQKRAELMARTFEQYADYFPGYRPTGPGIAGLRDTLEQCRAAGWRAGLVLMPESTEFRGWYPADGVRELDAALAGLATEYRVPLVDARGWVPDGETMDGHHLTGAGADRLTDRLVRESLAPWLGGAP